MSATNFALSNSRPFSSAKMQSSAKYFFHGSWLPGTTASHNSWVCRVSCGMTLPPGVSDAASEAAAERRRGRQRIQRERMAAILSLNFIFGKVSDHGHQEH